MARVTKVGVPGFIEVTLEAGEKERLRQRFRRQPLLAGPCLIIDRNSGLALDIGWEQKPGWTPWFWSVHGLAPQQWVVRKLDRDAVSITHDASGLALTAPSKRNGRPTVEKATGNGLQRWRLAPTDDRTAFLIRSEPTDLVLDSVDTATQGSHPVLWEENWHPWQQWVIARLPIT